MSAGEGSSDRRGTGSARQQAGPALPLVLLVCLLLSGASALIYEVAWVRLLELIFGTTTLAVATVLAAFMGGLAIGSWWMGSRSARFGHPLRVYATLEVLLACAALAMPVILRLPAMVMSALPEAIGQSFFAASLIRLVLCGAALLLPTALMGATLPAVSRLVTGGGAATCRNVGKLYAINTLGAVLGCSVAGFVLLPRLGLMRTQLIGVVINLAAAGTALLASRLASARIAPVSAKKPDDRSVVAPSADGGPVWIARLFVVAYMLSGFTAMVYEVTWSRLLVLVLGSSTYAYTIMLATFLLGLSIGAWLGARILDPARTPLATIALAQSIVALATWAGLFLVEELPFLYHVAFDRLHPTPHGLLGIQSLLAAALMIVPTIGLGAMFPATIGGLDPGGTRAPRVVGIAYAWNTIGAILGSVVAGFGLIPAIGTRDTLRLGIAVNGILALAALLAARSQLRPALRVAATCAVALFCLNVAIVAPRWSPNVLSSGIYRYVERYSGMDRATFRTSMASRTGDVLMFDEGISCTVSVVRTVWLRGLLINGKPEATVPAGLRAPHGNERGPLLGDLETQIMVAQLPLLMAPRIDDLLVIGLGSGVTVGSALTHPVRRADCVELEKAVVRGSHYFDDYNGAPLRDPRVSVFMNDGRNQLALGRASYDVIISQPSNPWLPGSASLFTHDFFNIVRRRLRPGGVFGQWIQLYELQSEDLLTLLRSFVAVFPEAHLFRVASDAILIGSDRPLSIDPAEIVRRASPAVRADLARIGLHSPDQAMAYWWTGGDALRAAIEPGPLNTDDNMRIEFLAPLRMLAIAQPEAGADPRRLFPGRAERLPEYVTLDGKDATEQAAFWSQIAEVALARHDPHSAVVFAEHSLRRARTPRACVVLGKALASTERDDEARAWYESALREFPRDRDLRRALAVELARGGSWNEVRDHAAILVALDSDDREAHYLLGKSRYQLGDEAGALETLMPLAIADPAPAAPRGKGAGDGDIADLDRWIGAAAVGAGHHREAVEPLRAYLRTRPDDAAARSLLAEALARSGSSLEADAVARRLQPDASERAQAALRQGREAWRRGDLPDARARVEEAWQFDPKNDAITLTLARLRSRQGDRAGAIALIRDFLVLQTDRPWAVGYLGQLLHETGDDDSARAMAKRYRALTGADWRAVDVALQDVSDR